MPSEAYRMFDVHCHTTSIMSDYKRIVVNVPFIRWAFTLYIHNYMQIYKCVCVFLRSLIKKNIFFTVICTKRNELTAFVRFFIFFLNFKLLSFSSICIFDWMIPFMKTWTHVTIIVLSWFSQLLQAFINSYIIQWTKKWNECLISQSIHLSENNRSKCKCSHELFLFQRSRI